MEAVLDVVSFGPSILQHLYLDATVRNALGPKYLQAARGSSVGPCFALTAAAKQKVTRFPDASGLHVLTAGMKQRGRFSDELHGLLFASQGQARANDLAHRRPPYQVLRRWLRKLSTGLALVQASIVAHAAGTMCTNGGVDAARAHQPT